MNLHVQVTTSTGGAIQVLIWGKIEQTAQLVRLHSEKEEKNKRPQFFAPRPFWPIQVYKFQILAVNDWPPAVDATKNTRSPLRAAMFESSAESCCPMRGEAQEQSPPTLLRLAL